MNQMPEDLVYLALDTETTGLPPGYKMCELGFREIDPVTLETLFELDELIDPECPIPAEATAVHGITDAMVADAPTKAQLMTMPVTCLKTGIKTTVQERYAGKSVVLICHNAPFDSPLVRDMFTVVGHICTLTWARRLFPKGPGGPADHKLPTLHQFFGYPESTAHRALADVDTTICILRTMLQKQNMTLNQFLRNGQHTVHTQPWGKFAGRPLLELPKPYLIWLWNLDNLEENHRESVKKALKVHGVAVPRGQGKIIQEVEA
jgi:DNA polymerase-3 subunit epsilon